MTTHDEHVVMPCDITEQGRYPKTLQFLLPIPPTSQTPRFSLNPDSQIPSQSLPDFLSLLPFSPFLCCSFLSLGPHSLQLISRTRYSCTAGRFCAFPPLLGQCQVDMLPAYSHISEFFMRSNWSTPSFDQSFKPTRCPSCRSNPLHVSGS